MAVTIRFVLRNDTAAAWEAANPVLLKGEPGFDQTNKRLKFGDGVTAWNDLPYVDPEVINNLLSDDEKAALSAAMGKALKGEIDTISEELTSLGESVEQNTTNITNLQEAQVTVVNNLTSTSTTDALSAAQGKVLNDNKAPLNSPALTGTPTAPTAAATTNSTQVATTAFVKTAVENGQPDTSGFLPKSGGTMTGALVAQSNTNYSTAQARNVVATTSDPGVNSYAPSGQITLVYEA
jgi:hypothetical protein